MRLIGALVMSVSLLAAGCGGSGDQATSSSTPHATAPAPAATARVADAPAAGGAIGVKECDDYFTRMEACLPKLAEQARGPVSVALGKQRTGFRQAASTPNGQVSLAATCKVLLTNVDNIPACK
jgi:hypothetical protein